MVFRRQAQPTFNRQVPGCNPFLVLLRPQERAWHPVLVPGLRVLSLGEFEGAHTALVEWAPGTRFQYRRHYGGEEIFVMEGGRMKMATTPPALGSAHST
jgi:hypothetical protein